jgi:hypothetical protein
MGIKLHVGSGGDIKPGYINIDQFDPRADLLVAIQDLNFAPDTVERIEGYMVLSHLPRTDALNFIRNAYHMLQPGGELIMECPDAAKVARLVLLFAHDPEYLEKGPFGLRGFFGEPTNHMTEGDYPKWGYTASTATELMKEGGFSNIRILDGISHYFPLRDLRVEAVK